MKLTIIPDVHGRPFWRDAVKDVAETPVVFLGDYLDPYPQDMVTWEESGAGDSASGQPRCALPRKLSVLLARRKDEPRTLRGNPEHLHGEPWSVRSGQVHQM